MPFLLIVGGLLAAMLTILLVVCALLSASARDLRIASMRLAGASRRQARIVLAGESFAISLIATGLGAGAFFILRDVLTRGLLGGFGMFSSDLSIGWGGGLVVLGTPVLAAVVTSVTARGAIMSPVEIRRGSGKALRSPWRIGLLIVGVMLQVAPTLSWMEAVSTDTRGLMTLGGIVTVVLAIPVVLPVLIRALGRITARRLDWITSQLAGRHLQHDPFTPSRIASVMSVAVVVLAAAQVFGEALATASARPLVNPSSYSQLVRVEPSGVREARKLYRSTLGITPLDARQFVRGDRGLEAFQNQVLFIECRKALLLLGMTAQQCPESGFRVLFDGPRHRICQLGSCHALPPLEPGREITVPRGGQTSKRITVPAEQIRPPSNYLPLFPEINPSLVLPRSEIAPPPIGAQSVGLTLVPGPAEEQRLRTGVARIDPGAQLETAQTQAQDERANAVFNGRILNLGSSIGLVVAGLVVVISGMDATWRRREYLRTLTLFGAPLGSTRLAEFLGIAVPVALSALLGVAQAWAGAHAYGRLGDAAVDLPGRFFIDTAVVTALALLSLWCIVRYFPVGRGIPRSE